MSKTLYEINQSILDALNRAIDPETGELLDCSEIDSLQVERQDKLEAYALLVKNLDAESKAIREEEKSLAVRRQQKERTIESLKQTLSMELDGQKLETSRVKVSWRKSQSVNVSDWKLLTEEFLRFSDPKPDLTAIKESLKQGFEVDGAELVENQNIQIK